MDALEAMANSMARGFSRSDFEAVADLFEFPCALYHQDNVLVSTDRAALIENFTKVRGMLAEMGVVEFGAEIVARPVCIRDRFTAWIKWIHFGECGKQIGESYQRLFFQSRPQGGYGIQMVDALQVSKPELLGKLNWN